MRLLVIGSNGLLGSNVVAAAQTRDWDVFGTYHSDEPAFDIPLTPLDITNTDEFREIINTNDFGCVINCAAMTDVDACERNPEQALAVNGRAPGKLAKVCAEKSIEFVHVSTDYVFDGEQRVPYSEDVDPNPIQEYGASKLAGEREVKQAVSDALIPRLSFVYGIHRSSDELTGFPAWVRDRIRDETKTPLFTDQHVTPTRAGQAAETFLDLLEDGCSGLFHVAARSCVTPYQFGVEICEQMDTDDSLFVEGSQADVDRDADRPSHTCLDVGRVEDVLGRSQPTLTEDLLAIEEAFTQK